MPSVPVSSMRTALITILTSLLLFACTGEQQEERTFTAERRQLGHTADRIETNLDAIRREASQLAEAVLQAKKNWQGLPDAETVSRYRLDESGVFYKHVKNGNSSLWVSGHAPLDNRVKNAAFWSEGAEGALQEACRSHRAVVQAYFNSADSLNRIYPPFDSLALFPAGVDITTFNFYYLADRQHNPERNAVWVPKPYVDPAGRGWMISAIAPVYENDTLLGVVGLDVTIRTLAERFLTGADLDTILVDHNGVVIAGREELLSLLCLPPLQDFKYFDSVRQDTFRTEDYNLRKSRCRNIRSATLPLLEGTSRMESTRTKGRKTIFLSEQIEGLDWTLIRVIQPDGREVS